MSKKTSNERFLNMPLSMLTPTITDPANGLRRIASFAIGNYAQSIETDGEGALIQAAYTRSQRPSEALPESVLDILEREEVDQFVVAIPECWGGKGEGEDFVATAREVLTECKIDLSPEEREALCTWHQLQRSADFFGRRIRDAANILEHFNATARDTEMLAREYGATVWATVPADWFFEVNDSQNAKEARLLRLVAACRSLIGRHRFTATTKSSIQMRAVGAKSRRQLEHLLQSPEVAAEFDLITRRRQFDNLMVDAVARGFITKLAPSKKAGGIRRVYMSVAIRSPKELANAINEANRRRKVREEEAEARSLIR